MCTMGLVYRLSHNCLFDIREIHAYLKRQTSDSCWEFLRIENKQIEIVRTIRMVKTGIKRLIY